MALTFSHAVGYRGYCKLRDSILLCTGGNINLTQQPMMGTGIWGAGYKTAAPISYAWNYLQLDGSANFELTDGGEWDSLKDFSGSGSNETSMRKRVQRSRIYLVPDGINGFDGAGWCASLGIEASQGSVITGNFNFKGDPYPNQDYRTVQNGYLPKNLDPYNYTSDGSGMRVYFSSFQGKNPPVGTWENTHPSTSAWVTADKSGIAGATLIPYWKTAVIVWGEDKNLTADNVNFSAAKTKDGESKSLITDIISWNCSYNSEIQLLKCCAYQESTPLTADYILLGQMSADLSFTRFGIKGQFNPNKYHTEFKNLLFRVGHSCIRIPLAIINSASTSMTNGTSYVSAEFSYNALGDGEHSIFNMGKWIHLAEDGKDELRNKRIKK